MRPLPHRTLQNLIQRFSTLDAAGHLERNRSRKWGKVDTAKTLLEEERLRTMSLEEADTLYRSLPISQRRRREFLSNPVEEIRECMWFLLYEELMYEIRVWEFLDEMGGFRLRGGNLSLAAALMGTQQPDLFGLINTYVDRGLRALGMCPAFDRNESYAGRFQKYQETLLYLTRVAPFPNFRVTDDFLEALAKGVLKAA